MSHNCELYKAFQDKSIGRFVEALEVFEADLYFNIKEKNKTLFEIILSTPDSANFVEKSLEYGADFYVKDTNHNYPIHYVIESGCMNNLRAVEPFLNHKESDDDNLRQSPHVNVKNPKGQNCLHLLAESLKDDNKENILQMMFLLLSYGCNINSPNDEQETPFFIIARKLPYLQNAQEIFDKFFQSTEIDFYTHRGDEIAIMVKDYIKELPAKEIFTVHYDEMRKLLEIGNINKFENFFTFYNPQEEHNTFQDNCYSYMEIAVQKSYINIVDLLIKKGINFNKISLENKTHLPSPFQAYMNADVAIFKSFLLASKNNFTQTLHQNKQLDSYHEINLYCNDYNCQKTLLHQFFAEMKKAGNVPKFQTIEMTSNQKKCFDLLINDDRCDRNYLNAIDKYEKSVVYYSVGFGVDYMTIKLLKKGAFIGKVITKMRKSMLNDFLDSCIQSNDEFHDNLNFQISIDYGFLIPTSDICEAIKGKKKKKMEQKATNDIQMTQCNAESASRHDVEENSIQVNNETKLAPEMWTLKLLANNYDYRHFVMHPVLSSFVFLKWKKIRFSLHINLLITLFYIFTFIPYIMISRSDQESLVYRIFFGLSFTSLFVLTCREILQMIQIKKRYIKSYSNIVDMTIITSSFIVLFRLPLSTHHFRMLHTVIILLVTWEYFNLLGYLPMLSVSLHTKMFRKVFTTFLKSLGFYSVMIIGFALAFFTLQGDKALTMKYNDTLVNNQSLINTESLNSFASLRSSVVKSFVMMIGELDSSSIYLEGYTYIGLFMLFLFIVTIVLYNLLNALAVSDTQEIRSEAKLIDLRQRILMMYKHEKYAFRITSKMGTTLQKIILLFSETIPKSSLHLKPNEGRNIYSTEDCTKPIKNQFLNSILCYFGQHMTMDKEIIQDMYTLLVKKREEENNQIIEHLKEKRSEKMAYDIIKINEQMTEQRCLMNELKELMQNRFEVRRGANMIDLMQ